MPKLCYIIGPYRPTSSQHHLMYGAAVDENIYRARCCASVVAAAGYYPVVPHNLSTDIEDIGDDDFWLALTMAVLSRCDAYYLVPGWEHSYGSRKEVEMASELGIGPCDLSALPS